MIFSNSYNSRNNVEYSESKGNIVELLNKFV